MGQPFPPFEHLPPPSALYPPICGPPIFSAYSAPSYPHGVLEDSPYSQINLLTPSSCYSVEDIDPFDRIPQFQDPATEYEAVLYDGPTADEMCIPVDAPHRIPFRAPNHFHEAAYSRPRSFNLADLPTAAWNTAIDSYPSHSRSTSLQSQLLSSPRSSTTSASPQPIHTHATHLDPPSRPPLKRSTSSPTATSTPAPPRSNRCRPRHRLPHTAVERRYRENLNAHLQALRAAVPSLQPGQQARRRNVGDTDAAEDEPKISKCEILMGAVEYIGQLEKERKWLVAELGRCRGAAGEGRGE